MKTILVATGNPGKLVEISAMLDTPALWLTLRDFPGIQEVQEDGQTFEENARKKALGYAGQTGLWTLADDSGLVVDALKGEPGVHSARFCGHSTDTTDRKTIDRLNYEKVLDLLRNIPGSRRTGRFVCHLCLASPQKILLETHGQCEGLILDTPRGENGFGYDPIFFVPSLNRTIAELSTKEKNAVSHRGNAFIQFKPMLRKLLENSPD
ncbi:MAG: RdgB/HAM1 family non-canonical purine NTP pyrophosphatase [Phycisphaerae bacterium]|nr:RdgB/HAM1 family non-canonical purine NTP pyrophosphatase [Phycisphaerae bacterium]